MPVRVTRLTSGKYRVSTPSGVKAKATTKSKAASQARLLNALEHNPNFKPRAKAAGRGNMNKAKLGGGARFKAIENKAKASGAKNPAAVAAAAGIKKYGQKAMTKMAVAGRKRSAKKR